MLYTRQQVQETVEELAGRITRDYAGKNPLLVGVLKGSFIFMADLARRLDFPLEIEFLRVSSYGRGTESSGRVTVVQGMRAPARGRHVLVVEDIVDTGLSIARVMESLRARKPASLGLCCLLDKPSRRRAPVRIDYAGLTVPDRFLVGYGLDYAERYRNLPDICYLEEQQ